MKNLTLMIMMVICNAVMIYAEPNLQRPDTYNYNHGIEKYEKDSISEAYTYFCKEIEENPTNGYAYAYIASVYYNTDKYGRLLLRHRRL